MDVAALKLEDLLLRRPELGDPASVHAVHTDPRVWAYHPSGRHESLDQTRELLDEVVEHGAAHGFGDWTLVADGIGIVGLGGLRHHELEGESVLNAYYRLAPESQGRGYATRVLAAGLTHVAPVLVLPVVVRTHPENAAAIRVALKLGLEDSGVQGPQGHRFRVLRSSQPPVGKLVAESPVADEPRADPSGSERLTHLRDRNNRGT